MIINGISAVIALEYISHGLKKRYKGQRGMVLFLAGCTAYFFAVTMLNHYTRFEGLLGLCYGIILYGYCVLAAEGKKMDFFLLSVVWVLIAFISAYVMFAIWGLVTGEMLGQLIVTNSREHLYFALAAGALRFSFGRMALAVYRRRQHEKLLAEDCMLVLIFLVFFLLILFMFRLEEGRLEQRERYYLSLWILGGIFLVLLLLGGFYQLLGKYRLEKMAEEYQEESQRRQEEQIHDLYRIGREANRMRHDMSAKLSVVYMQMKKGAYEDAEKSLKKLGAEWGEYLEIPDDTGNEGLNAALIKSIHECREKGIRFHYAVLGNVNGIDSLDMGNLVHNLLQNGIEACSRQGQEREMEIVVRRDRDMIEIEMDNTAQEYVLKKNPLLKTSKKEKEKHGFGMESIREIVERYHGNYELWEEKGHFFQRITLKIKCEQAGHDTERV